MDDADDLSTFRLTASQARSVTRLVEKDKRRKKREKEKQKLRKAKGKDKDSAIEIPSSPSIVSIASSTPEEDDEDEFEEVAIPGHDSLHHTPAEGDEPIEGDGERSYLTEEEEDESQVIRLELGGKTEEEKTKELELALRKKPITAKDRAVRMDIHKIHTVCLLASARIRNHWASDDVLKARLLSLLPHHLHAAFHISPKRFPDRAQRSRLFIEALQSLATWWSQNFFDIPDETLGQRTRPWDQVQEVIDSLPAVDRWELKGGKWASRYVKVLPPGGGDHETKERKKKKGKGKEEEMDPMMESLTEVFGGERLRSVNSMMKKCLQQEGSRDVSAQLFVSLARACGLGARLVVSIQAVPWRAEKIPVKKKGAGSGGRTTASRQGMGTDPVSEEDEMEEVPIPGPSATPTSAKKAKSRAGRVPKSDDPADIYRLRKPRPAPQTLGSSFTTPTRPQRKLRKESELLPKISLIPVMTAQPPVFWAEVFSRSDQRWVPVDPVRGIVRKKAHYVPASDSGTVRMVYVVAYEEDGFARDVTLRYAKNFGARTCKLRPLAKPGEEEWWPQVVRFLQRPQRLNRDDLEDAELEMSQGNEAMPLVVTGFKDHPLYVLERHLRMNEVILPKREIGRFKGEPVYRRSNVLVCKTAETWMRVGRQVKPRQEPLKWIKQRAVTIQKRRAQELAIQEGHEPLQQGLYAEYQTELYKPPPIKDGIVPQNAFGNIDLYTPSMLPEGAVHLPYKGIAKVARQLGISFAEAVTSFEFKKQKATPVITGIVVAKENEDVTLDAYWKSTAAAEEKEKARRETAALKRWAKLINGMRVRNRLRAEYGMGDELHERTSNPMGKDPQARSAASIIATTNKESTANWQAAVHGRLSPPLEYEEETDEKPDIAEESAGEDNEVADVPVAEPEPRQLRIRLRVPSSTTPQPPQQVSIPETTRPRRSQRGVADNNLTTNGNGLSTPPAPTPPSQTKVTGKAKAKTSAKRGRKRRADSESAASETDSDVAPTRTSHASRAPAPVPAPTRTLRSRAAKSEAQQRAEEEKRNRIRDALDSDDE